MAAASFSYKIGGGGKDLATLATGGVVDIGKIKNRDSKFCVEFDADSKTVLVFFLALIIFDFYSFEGSKTHFTGDTGETNIYMYAYIEYY